MKFFSMLTTFFFAFFLEFSGFFPEFAGVRAPLIFFWAALWFPHLKLYPRLWLGIFVGFFLDSFHLFPVGTLPILFSLLAYASELADAFFSKHESEIITFLYRACIIFIGVFATPFIGGTMGWARGVAFLPFRLGMFQVLIPALFWGTLIPFIVFSFRTLGKRTFL